MSELLTIIKTCNFGLMVVGIQHNSHSMLKHLELHQTRLPTQDMMMLFVKKIHLEDLVEKNGLDQYGVKFHAHLE